MSIKKTIRQVADTIGIKGELKKEQVNAIKDGLDGQDLFMIAPTSFGKSAIFQILAIMEGELTIVIVPTLSLLHDQVDQLQQRQLSVGALASDCMSYDEFGIQRALKQYGYLILYTTPESLWKLDLSDIPVSLLVVDECHCVTSWGYGFRAAYLEIGDFLKQLPRRPQVVALTATAPVSDREKIKELLHMKHIKEYEISLYRPKLTFSVYSFVSEEKRQKELKRLLKQYSKSGDGSCIIYCNTRAQTKEIYDLVKKWYPKQVSICHSNLSNGERKRNEQAFMSGERRIMVATSAFGMGVNKSDVRLIIHYNLPLSIIDYYQQAGRAGRDGSRARCILLYRKSDYDLNRWVIEQNQDPAALGYSLRALDEMKEYADDEKGCMVQRMLLALGEKLDKPCGRCTYCQKARRHK
ncbi:RecQ family ATP-dependent DNA helicase [Pseudoflavonifractor capillosus]|uniref:RecQ family ATP-dependent DNA helicase n=1 Tax=Pseudoflavonifractor capillosus TaxID=106588 RepID=UPI00195D0614|nr:RecQ family ATP-dependent DNA helicase [Pseudoflavonifractor capillosus]MBM6681783.1 ATP-dependent DNA helicase RecQ [Pseudoflavonifractor capillosus]